MFTWFISSSGSTSAGALRSAAAAFTGVLIPKDPPKPQPVAFSASSLSSFHKFNHVSTLEQLNFCFADEAPASNLYRVDPGLPAASWHSAASSAYFPGGMKTNCPSEVHQHLLLFT
eukprot:superscaffoldBa00008920_g23732